jgi:energy-converting hydrogenase A subunit R
MILVFDLEGPLSPMDHAAEAMRAVGGKLGKPDFFDFFEMLSLYDDVLTLEERPGYNPGDTLRLIAPIVSTQLSDRELRAISGSATLTPGARDLIASLNPEDVYVASTSYQQHALAISKQLGIKDSQVNCTKLRKYGDFPYLNDLMAVFRVYKKSGMDAVKKDLDEIFWDKMGEDYLDTIVCGGRRKEEVVEFISRQRNKSISEFIVVGDSITDMHILARVAKEGGVAISFNGNQYSAPKANLAVSANSLMAIRPIIDGFKGVWGFVERWNSARQEKRLNLLKPETRDYFIQHKVEARYDDLRAVRDFGPIIKKQKEMRAFLRSEYAKLT